MSLLPLQSRCLGAITWLVLIAGPVLAENVVSDAGLYITVPNPITSDSVVRIKNRLEAARSKPAEQRPGKIIFDFNPAEKEANTSEFGPCYDLGKVISALTDTITVGYIHRKTTGHTVFPVMSCQQLVCGPMGQLGDVLGGAGGSVRAFEANGYWEVAVKDRPQLNGLIKKMIDPDVQLRQGRKAQTVWFVDLREKAKYEKEGISLTDSKPISAGPDGKIGLFPAAVLRELGISRATPENRQEVLDAFGLGAGALREDPLAGRTPVAYRTIVRGPIDQGVREGVRRLAQRVIREKGNLLFLQLEANGGDLQAARDLADDLRRLESEEGLQVVAFIPDKAPDTAAIVALGCRDIVMSKRQDAGTNDTATEAEFGDFEAYLAGNAPQPGNRPRKGPRQPQEMNIDLWASSLRELAEAQGYPALLVEGFLRRDIEIVKVHRKDNRSVSRLMTEADFKQDKDRGANAEWVLETTVKPKGQLLKLSASRAEQLGIARFVTQTRDTSELYAKYGVTSNTVKDATPAWLDRFAEMLKIPPVTVLLVVIGFTGLILELKVPGSTVPGIVSALCFILVFWAHTQFSGQVVVLSALLFVLGLVLIMLEVFVLPGFGVSGIIGIILMLGSLALVIFNEIPSTSSEWLQLAGKAAQLLLALMASVILAIIIARFLPKIPYANRLMLVPPAEKPGAESEPPVLPGVAEAASLLGVVGTTVTVLRPAGSVRFGDRFVDVVTDGTYIPAGTRVQVVEVEATRIVVKEV
jgi:membrane-bound serine protease (ClpP class)